MLKIISADGIRVKERHVEQLTRLLVQVAARLQEAPLQLGHKLDAGRESLHIENIIKDWQSDETERDEQGDLNPALAMCVITALETALLKTGRKVYHGDKLFSCDAATNTLSAVPIDRDDIASITAPDVVGVGGCGGPTNLDYLSISGHNVKNALAQLSEPVLRDAAREAIGANLEETTAYTRRLFMSRLMPPASRN